MSQAALAHRAKSPEAFRTISEVADELDVPQHVLRFWEGRFSQIKPVKRAGSRRYYRPDDIDLLRGIRSLLYVDGYTIKGVQKILRDRGIKHVMAIGQGRAAPAPVAPPAPPPAESRVTPFRPRVVKPKPAAPRGPDLFDTLDPSPPEKLVAKIARAFVPEEKARVTAEEKVRLEALLSDLEQLKVRLKKRPGQA